MTKFSDFIRSPGTAGPPTVEGIYDLGFALRSEIPPLFDKYVRVDAAQSFTAPEQAQGRENIDAQKFSASLTSLAGVTTAADRLPYTTAANTWAVTTLTAFARTILDDTNAAGVRTTIGLGNVDNTSDVNKPISTATQTALDLKAPLASPTLTGVPTAPTASPGTNTTQIATTAFVLANLGVISKGYESAEQTVTTGGALTLPHGMGVKPKFVTLEIICKIAESTFLVNQTYEMAVTSNNEARGAAIRKDATNIYVQYSNATNVLALLNSSGVNTQLTNANWRLIVRAFA